jgi:hypothetical protein
MASRAQDIVLKMRDQKISKNQVRDDSGPLVE